VGFLGVGPGEEADPAVGLGALEPGGLVFPRGGRVHLHGDRRYRFVFWSDIRPLLRTHDALLLAACVNREASCWLGGRFVSLDRVFLGFIRNLCITYIII